MNYLGRCAEQPSCRHTGALSELSEQGIKGPLFAPVQMRVINPKSVTMGQLYGEADKATQVGRQEVLAGSNTYTAEDAGVQWLQGADNTQAGGRGNAPTGSNLGSVSGRPATQSLSTDSVSCTMQWKSHGCTVSRLQAGM
jgi:hypothetical protein